MKPILTDKDQFPTDELLLKTLGAGYGMYETLRSDGQNTGFTFGWRYYNDGRSWLCPVKKGTKTIYWLSAWDDGMMRITFYFAPRLADKLLGLGLGENVRNIVRTADPQAKLMAILLEATRDNLPDIRKLAMFKLSAK